MTRRVFLLALGLLLVPWAAARAAVFSPACFTLANGLTLIVVPNPMAPVVSQMVWYKAGAADEAGGKSGLAHYLEHLMFRGTKTIPAGAFSKIIAAQGGEDNAFTSYDYTAYFERVAADRLPMIMQMEADRMRFLSLDPKTSEAERQVVLGERQERTDNSPQGLFLEKLRQLLMPHHPYGRPVIGWERDIDRLSLDDVRAFYDARYAPNNAIVVISGDVDVKRVVALAAATYGRVPRRSGVVRTPMPSIEAPAQTSFRVDDSRVDQTEVLWSFLVPSYGTQKKREAYAYEVLSEILDAGEVGLFYQDLVVDKKVANGVQIRYDPDARGPAMLAIAASLRDGVALDVLQKALRGLITRLAAKGLASQQVEEAKHRLERQAIFVREGLMAPGYAFGAALTTGHAVADVEAWPERIRAVTVDEVNAALRALASSSHQVMGVLAPKPEGDAS
ncbi:MAG: pitrilysin family protein [Alphaproteobacteria bacterium]|nr:pitrilysin family protein [Alphaproteobacteria bacterium]